MSVTIYKESSYVTWNAAGSVLPMSINSSSTTVVPSTVDLSNYYTKLDLLTPDTAVIDWTNIVNVPSLGDNLWEADSGGVIISPIDPAVLGIVVGSFFFGISDITTEPTITPVTNIGSAGINLTVKGGDGVSTIANPDVTGGNLYLYGGKGDGAAPDGSIFFSDSVHGILSEVDEDTNVVMYNLAGGRIFYSGMLKIDSAKKVYIGTGSAGTNPLPAAGVDDTYMLTYNPTTGQISCGDGSGLGGDSLWEDGGENLITPSGSSGVGIQVCDVLITNPDTISGINTDSYGGNLTIKGGDGDANGGNIAIHAGSGPTDELMGLVELQGYCINLIPFPDGFVYLYNTSNSGDKVCLQAYGSSPNGIDLILLGGAGLDNPSYGGAVRIMGGAGNSVGGVVGKVFIGTGSAGTNPLAGSGTGTSILLYNRATGEITFGDK